MITHSAQLPGDKHITEGQRDMIPVLAKSAVAAGCDGIHVEVHNDPPNAKSDASTQWPLQNLKETLEVLISIYEAVRWMEYDINNIKMIISDVDGVWTDGSIYIGIKNSEFKKFNVNDGACYIARDSLVLAAPISRESTQRQSCRAKIEDVYNGTPNKIPIYEELKSKYNLTDSEVAYLGDDLIDIPVMQKVGVPIATQMLRLP